MNTQSCVYKNVLSKMNLEFPLFLSLVHCPKLNFCVKQFLIKGLILKCTSGKSHGYGVLYLHSRGSWMRVISETLSSCSTLSDDLGACRDDHDGDRREGAVSDFSRSISIQGKSGIS